MSGGLLIQRVGRMSHAGTSVQSAIAIVRLVVGRINTEMLRITRLFGLGCYGAPSTGRPLLFQALKPPSM